MTDITENSADLHHFGPLHSLPFGAKFVSLEMVSLENSYDPDKKHVFISDATSRVRLFGKILLSPDLRLQQYGPCYSHVKVNVGFVHLESVVTVTPVAPLLCSIAVRVYCHPMLSLFGTAFFYYELDTIQSDIPVWNHKKYMSKPVLVKEDEAILRHRRWFSQFYSENSPRFTFYKGSIDW